MRNSEKLAAPPTAVLEELRDSGKNTQLGVTCIQITLRATLHIHNGNSLTNSYSLLSDTTHSTLHGGIFLVPSTKAVHCIFNIGVVSIRTHKEGINLPRMHTTAYCIPVEKNFGKARAESCKRF